MCKWSDPFSRCVLIDRGLDQVKHLYSDCESRYYSVLKARPSKVNMSDVAKKAARADNIFFVTAGVDDGEVPPVPIPNTEVKLTCAEDSWLDTAWLIARPLGCRPRGSLVCVALRSGISPLSVTA